MFVMESLGTGAEGVEFSRQEQLTQVAPARGKWFIFLVSASAAPSNVPGTEVEFWEEVKKEGRFWAALVAPLGGAAGRNRGDSGTQNSVFMSWINQRLPGIHPQSAVGESLNEERGKQGALGSKIEEN